MRRKMLAGNWKMNLTPLEARQLIRALRAEIDPALSGSVLRAAAWVLAPTRPNDETTANRGISTPHLPPKPV